MTNEEKEIILAAIKINYPKGTTIESAQSGDTYILGNKWYINDNGDVRCETTCNCVAFVKYEGRWSKIISLPVPEIINNYQIY